MANWVRHISAIALGSLLLTAWDFVLDPAMSQTAFPFWEFQEAGAFFGMPYRNLAGWMGTGAVFMSVAALLWGNARISLQRSQLGLPLIVYVVNFAFGAVITLGALDARYLIPTSLSVLLGVVPAVILWWIAAPAPQIVEDAPSETDSLIIERAELPAAAGESRRKIRREVNLKGSAGLVRFDFGFGVCCQPPTALIFNQLFSPHVGRKVKILNFSQPPTPKMRGTFNLRVPQCSQEMFNFKNLVK